MTLGGGSRPEPHPVPITCTDDSKGVLFIGILLRQVGPMTRRSEFNYFICCIYFRYTAKLSEKKE